MLDKLLKSFEYHMEKAERDAKLAKKENNPCRRDDLFHAIEQCGYAHALQNIIHKEWALADDVERMQRWHGLASELSDLWEEL